MPDPKRNELARIDQTVEQAKTLADTPDHELRERSLDVLDDMQRARDEFERELRSESC